MGDTAEQMAKTWEYHTRERQDALALRSNQAAGHEEGKLTAEVMTATRRRSVNLWNRITTSVRIPTLADYQKLRPAFDRKHGSVTAANSTPLTRWGGGGDPDDRIPGYKAAWLIPLGYLRSYALPRLMFVRICCWVRRGRHRWRWKEPG